MATFSGLSPLEATSSSTAKREDARRPPASGRAARGRPAAPEGRRAASAGHPGHGPADRAPRVEGPEHVAEQHAQRHEPQPEDHVDERGREVGGGALDALEPGVDHEAEQERRRSRRRRSRPGGWRARGRTRRQRAPAFLLELGFRPEDGQRDEGDDQHHRRGPAEEPLRNGKVGPGNQPVGDLDHEGVRRVHHELGDERVVAGVLRRVALDLEHALEVGLEAEARGRSGRRVRGHVVAVQVDLVLGVRQRRRCAPVRRVVISIRLGPPST